MSRVAEIPEFLKPLWTKAAEVGVKARLRRTGSIASPKPGGGHVLFRTFAINWQYPEPVVVLEGTDALTPDAWSAIVDEAHKVSTGAWSNCA